MRIYLGQGKVKTIYSILEISCGEMENGNGK
jgi:hypothetical protein